MCGEWRTQTQQQKPRPQRSPCPASEVLASRVIAQLSLMSKRKDGPADPLEDRMWVPLPQLGAKSTCLQTCSTSKEWSWCKGQKWPSSTRPGFEFHVKSIVRKENVGCKNVLHNNFFLFYNRIEHSLETTFYDFFHYLFDKRNDRKIREERCNNGRQTDS